MTGRDARVLVAVPTFRRTDLLPRLVAAIRTEIGRGDAVARIVLVDNDPARSAARTAEQLDVGYLHEPVPGIAAARQRALDAAAADEVVVMIDDDLVPEPGWLPGLLEVWRETGAAVVMGFVRYVWPQGTDPWIVAGGFMRRNRPPSGTTLRALATGNVLIDAPRVAELGVRFDTALGLAGGEDMQFGRDVLARGGMIVASADSVARDEVPIERTTREFARRRTIAQGQTRSRLLSRGRSPVETVLRRGLQLAGGAARMLVFNVTAAVAAIRRDRTANAVFRRRAWFAWGRVLGSVGRITPEYARTDASPR